MTKRKATMEMLLRGGYTYDEIAAAAHVSKRDVRECAKELERRGITAAEPAAMGDEAIEALFRPAERGGPSATHLQPDMAAYVDCKRRDRKLPLPLFRGEYRDEAVAAGLEAYAYSTFRQKLSDEAKRSGATRHFEHVPGGKPTSTGAATSRTSPTASPARGRRSTCS